MMTFVRTYKRWIVLAALGAVGLAITLGVLAVRQPDTMAPEEITLFAKDVAFRLASQPGEANPSLRLTKGTPVKLVIRNDEPGQVLHCFTIGGLGVGTTRNLETGESELLTFTPTERGTFAYACLMHPGMGGKVVVQ